MAQAELKTKATKVSADAFISKIADQKVRQDCRTLVAMMKQVTKEEPVMWGPSIIGFGTWHYKYESGREGEICMMGFSPRKQNLSLYIVCDFKGFEDELARLGKHKTGKCCLYIKRLADIDQKVLKQMMVKSAKQMKAIAKAPTAQQGMRDLHMKESAKKKTKKKAAKK